MSNPKIESWLWHGHFSGSQILEQDYFLALKFCLVGQYFGNTLFWGSSIQDMVNVLALKFWNETTFWLCNLGDGQFYGSKILEQDNFLTLKFWNEAQKGNIRGVKWGIFEAKIFNNLAKNTLKSIKPSFCS